MYSDIPTYREQLAELTEQLRTHGHLGLVLVDASQLAQVEHDYGSKAFEQVLSMVTRLVTELRGKEVRSNDLLALNDRGGNAFLVFLSPRRGEKEGRVARLADLETVGPARRRPPQPAAGRAQLALPAGRGRASPSATPSSSTTP